MENILIVSNYYPPEKGAAANRIEQLAVNLQKNGFAVQVVCPLANYPEGKLLDGYRGMWRKRENLRGVEVRRLWIYPSNSKNPVKRVLSTASFTIGLFLFLLFGTLPKKVIVQSPPLLLSFVSVLALKLRRRHIILNVSDLWPSAAVELGVLKPESAAHRLLLRMESFIYRAATVVLGQSNEIITHVRGIVPNKPCFLYRNLPEHESPLVHEQRNDGEIRIFYAGLLGVAQGVFESCQKMMLDKLPISFHIFGDGAEKQSITDWLTTHPGGKQFFHGMVPRRELHAKLSGFDIAFVPLTTRIYGSVPSKIFEYATLGIPILYFGGGEGEDIVRDYELGWVVPVGDFEALNATLREISRLSADDLWQMKTRLIDRAQRHFDLDAQMRHLLQEGVF